MVIKEGTKEGCFWEGGGRKGYMKVRNDEEEREKSLREERHGVKPV
jgi:hypothetical protein